MSKFGKINKAPVAAASPTLREEPITETVVDKPTPSPVKKIEKSTVAAMQLSSHAALQPDAIAGLHKAMRQNASINTSYRFSKMEKQRLDVALFELKMRGYDAGDDVELKTNENEIVRIAVNHLLNEYKANGDNSVLVKTLLSLRA